MSPTPIQNILDKLDELRTLFILGQRTIPYLEEMFFFIKDISALLDDINASIRESTVKMMPHATSRLESVTQATEMATTEILDLVDGALGNVWKLKKRVEESTDDIEALARVDARMIRLLRAALSDRDDLLLAQVEGIHHEKKSLRRRLAEQIRADVDALDVINEKLNRIMLALQVQDITAQQLAAVNHLIESIRGRMGSLMARMGTSVLSREEKETTRRFMAFDPDAQYDRSGEKQRVADEVVAAFEDPGTPPSRASQDTIDRLFAGAGDDGDSGPASQDAIDRLFKAQGGAPASQDDIDKLFGA